MIILVDMDGVMADLDSRFLTLWREKHPDKGFMPSEERKDYYIIGTFPEELKGLAFDIFSMPGFFRSLPPIPGGAEAVHEMEALGHEVYFCTAPMKRYKHCVPEKYQWIEEHVGRRWTQRLILTRDKTLVSGDVLIDDRPHIRGVRQSDWEHVLYDQPFNRGVPGKRRLTWENWKEVLEVT
jgi:5'-nucleotidase